MDVHKYRLQYMAKTVIALVNRKGGTGKTTSAIYLAAALHAHGRPVIGLDADPDASWLKMHAAGLLPYQVAQGDRDRLGAQVDEVDGIVIIDTPPNDEAAIFIAAGLADEVLIPLAPTGLDVGRLLTTVNTVAHVERMRNRPLGSVLVTRYRQRLIVAREIIDELEQRGMPLLESKIRQLTEYEKFDTPTYLEEYEAVLRELEVL